MSVLKEIHSRDFSFHYGEDRPTGRTYVKHCHFLYEAYYLMEGETDYIVAGERFSLKSGCLLLIPPCVFHCARPSDSGGPYRRAVMMFSPPAACGDRPLLYRVNEEIRALFDRLISYADRLDRTELDYIASAYPGELMILLNHASPLRTAGAQSVSDMPEPVRRAVAFINDRLTEEFSLSDVAAAAGVNRHYLCHTFTKCIGEGVMEYARHRKLEEARLMIDAGIRPGKAADRTGFDNYTTFYRAYKRLYGAAPHIKRS